MCVRYGHSSLTVDETLPLETCDTVHANGAWGYTADHTPKDIDTLVRLLVPPRPRTCNTEGGLRLGSVLRLGSCLATRILSCDSDPVWSPAGPTRGGAKAGAACCGARRALGPAWAWRATRRRRGGPRRGARPARMESRLRSICAPEQP